MGVSAVAAVSRGVHGFPAELTSFVGREEQVREVAGLLGRYRLVTGPGGAGKTGWSAAWPGLWRAGFADGEWLVELAPVQDPAQVPAVVAAALKVREQPAGRRLRCWPGCWARAAAAGAG